MTLHDIIRYTGAILVLISIALPLSNCKSKEDLIREKHETNIEKKKNIGLIFHPYDWFIDSHSFQGVVILLAYCWPIILIIIRKSKIVTIKKNVLYTLEFLLCLVSFLIIFVFGHIGEPLIGMYISLIGVTIYLLANFTEIYTNYKSQIL